MLLHAHYVADHSEVVVVKSVDTDVFIICLAMSKEFSCQLLFHTGTETKIRTIDVQLVRKQLDDEISQAMLGLHALSGCDSVSGFYGKGKVKGAKLLFTEKTYQETLGELGMQHDLSENLFNEVQKYVCHLYGQADCIDVNTARYNLFRLGKHSDELLPPTKDSLKKHVMRANYQAAVWRRSLEQLQDLPTPVGKGWKLSEDGTLTIDWCDLPPAPDTILKTVQCSCKTWIS
jgi:5'-3' exonuclease